MTVKYCAWCGSSDTYFMGYVCWEEDERGNPILVDYLEGEYTPKEEKHWCNECDGAFLEPLPGEDHPTLPDDFSIPDDEDQL